MKMYCLINNFRWIEYDIAPREHASDMFWVYGSHCTSFFPGAKELLQHQLDIENLLQPSTVFFIDLDPKNL